LDSGFYAACAGLKSQSQALEVVAHNLANLNTAGFHGELVSFQSLLTVTRPALANALNLAVNNFGVIEGTHMNTAPGSLLPTGNPLDVGIEGQGYFVVQTARGLRYTRNGSFHVSSSGDLVTATGDTVNGGAPIILPPGPVSIGADGTVSVNGAIVGTIQLVVFDPGTKLTAEGDTLLDAPEGGAKPDLKPTLRQGALESSNVNSIESVVTLLGVQRQAEMMGRALSLFDSEFNQIASTQLAKV
jgi:flagellar basal-body rod protein FlgF/flagellar basal-body rod protein FlgG